MISSNFRSLLIFALTSMFARDAQPPMLLNRQPAAYWPSRSRSGAAAIKRQAIKAKNRRRNRIAQRGAGR